MVECRTRDAKVLGSNPSVAKKKISHRSNQNNTTTNPSAPELKYLKLSEVKTRSRRGAVVECRTWDPEVPSSNPSVAKKKISHCSNQNNTTTNPPCTRVKYLKLSEVKTRSRHCTMVECRTRDPEVPSSNPGVAQKNISYSSNQNNTTTNPFAPELKYLKLSEVKSRSHSGVVVECRSRDPKVPNSNPSVAKKKISHRSNQNNTTTNPSTPDLNTWNCQRWKPEVTLAQL